MFDMPLLFNNIRNVIDRGLYCAVGNRSSKCLSFNYHKRLYCDQTNNNYVIKAGKLSETHSSFTETSLHIKFDVFKDVDAPILLDVFEEKMQLESEVLNDQVEDQFHGLNLNHGVEGVFDIEDLIDLLRRDKAEDIFVAALPPETKYVDYIVIVSGRSRKHMAGLADIVRRVFKKKRSSCDVIPRVEGEKSQDWMALDLGNIALHIFSPNARNEYDLESLWSVGSTYDPLINVPEDALISLLKKHEISLSDISDKGKLL